MSNKFAKEDFLFKILLVGDCGVGKSALLRRFADNQYDESYVATIGVDFKIKTILVDRMLVKLQLWDTAGQERFQSITQTYYRGCDGVFLVVDMTNMQTLRQLAQTWISEVTRFCGITDKDDPKSPVMFVLANKCDKTAELQIKDAHLSNLLLPHYKTSAKDGINVQKAFEDMATQIIAKRTQHHRHLLRQEGEPQTLVSLYRKQTKIVTLDGEEADESKEDGGCLC